VNVCVGKYICGTSETKNQPVEGGKDFLTFACCISDEGIPTTSVISALVRKSVKSHCMAMSYSTATRYVSSLHSM